MKKYHLCEPSSPRKGRMPFGRKIKIHKKNEVHVIDIAKLSEDKQAFVFGDAVRTIYNLQLGNTVRITMLSHLHELLYLLMSLINTHPKKLLKTHRF